MGVSALPHIGGNGDQVNRGSSLLIGALLVLLAQPVAAQQRPLVTEDPETIGAGRILLEGGIECTHIRSSSLSMG